MAKSKSDISNQAIRVFLQNVGEFYDKKRGYKPFRNNIKCKNELLASFKNECCFCSTPIDINSVSLDHLIPINKDKLGLNAWGNVVPCCAKCNKDKHNKDWEVFVNDLKISSPSKNASIKSIKHYIKMKKYNPNLDLKEIANNLYSDIGAVAQALIDLRFKQAEDKINQIIP